MENRQEASNINKLMEELKMHIISWHRQELTEGEEYINFKMCLKYKR
jgi:hypothetical protein